MEEIPVGDRGLVAIRTLGVDGSAGGGGVKAVGVLDRQPTTGSTRSR
jgi:hypothetical protein